MMSASSAQPPACRQARIEELTRTAISMTYVSWPHRFVQPVAKIVQYGPSSRNVLTRSHLHHRTRRRICKLLILLPLMAWLLRLDSNQQPSG
jgi:hypothetical protein